MDLENWFYIIILSVSTITIILWAFQLRLDINIKSNSIANFTDLTPSDANLDKSREPYHLLNGVLENAPSDTIGSLTACACNSTDFEARTNLTGNYLQRTNNYIRSYPDNCTGPLHDFTMAFYKVKTL